MKYWKTFVAVLAIFIGGALSGALGARIYLKHRLHQIVSEGPRFRGALLRRIPTAIDLNPEQRPAIEEIVRDAERQLFSMRDETRSQMNKVFEEALSKIEQQLDEKQRKQLARLKEERSFDNRRSPTPFKPLNFPNFSPPVFPPRGR